MRCIVVSLLLLECLSSTIFEGEKIYEIVPRHQQQVDFLHGLAHGHFESTDAIRSLGDQREHLLAGLDFWSHPSLGEPMSVRVPVHADSAFLSLMGAMNIQSKVTIDNVPELFEQQWRRDVRKFSIPPEDSHYPHDQKMLKELGLSSSSPRHGKGSSSHAARRRVHLQEQLNRLKAAECDGDSCCEQYKSYDEIVEWMMLMKDTYHYVDVIEIGKSYENRTIYAIEIDANPAQQKPMVVLDGTIHAREWAAPATVTWLAEKLIAGIGNKTDDWDVSEMATAATWVLAPVFNPDGYEYTRTTNRMWRKNRQPTSDHSSCIGTDLCRNSEAGFGGPGSSSSQCHDTYHGPSAWSAPETLAFKNFLDAQPNLKLYINFHAYSQLFLMPYGYTKDECQDHDELMAVSERVQAAIMKAEGQDYEIGPAASTIYYASGIMNDYVYDSGVKYSFAVELRPAHSGRYGFNLPADQICDMGREILAALKVLVGQVMREWRGL